TDLDLQWAAESPSSSQNYMGNQGNYDSAILATGASTVYVAGQNMVLVTTNTGGAWTNITKDGSGNAPAADFHAIAAAGPNANGTQFVFGSDGGVWTLNPGNSNSWTDLNGFGLAISQLNSISGTPASPTGFFAGSQPSGIDTTTGSQAWTMNFDNNGALPFGGHVIVNPNNAQTIFAWVSSPEEVGNPNGTPTANLYESTDGGKTWNPFKSVTANFETPRFIIASADVNGLRLRAGGNSLFESFNGVPNPLFSGTVTAISLATNQGPFLNDPSFPDAINYGVTVDDPDII